MRFLIVKTSSLGDIIHSFPVVSFLKKKFPHSSVDWVVEERFSELPLAHPQIDRVITIDSKSWRKSLLSKQTRAALTHFKQQLQSVQYDAVFDLQGNTKSALVTFLARALKKVGFGRKTVAEWPNLLATNQRYNPPSGLNIRDDYLFLPRTLYQDFVLPVDHHVELIGDSIPFDLVGDKNIMVCPGSAWPNKRLPEKALERILLDQQPAHFYIAWGNDLEKRQAQHLQGRLPSATLLEKMPLSQLQKVMSRMHLVIAVDSLPLHLAGTTRTPTLSFFGPSVGAKYAPIGEQHRWVQGVCPYGKSFEKRCPILRTCGTGACMGAMQD